MEFPKPFYKWRPHPWHGLETGKKPPRLVNAYIEITPFDVVKYEVDKSTGYLKVDRPQRTSSQPPVLYGFIPKTFCGKNVQKLMKGAKAGDQDPLDICVLSERDINRAEVVISSRVIGGIPMLDDGEADDKIIAVMENDNLWSEIRDIKKLPHILVERIAHYFQTYKMEPKSAHKVKVGKPYGIEHAKKVIQASIKDYKDQFG